MDLKHTMEKAIELIKEGLTYKNPCVTWSGGRCSTVVLWLALREDPNIRVCFNDTGIEYPEIRKFIADLEIKWKLNLIRTKPKLTFKQVQEKYPGQLWGMRGTKEDKRRAPACCRILKEYPMKAIIKKHEIEAIYTGMRACESRVRWLTSYRLGQSYCAKTWKVQKIHPIMHWSDEYLLQTIKKYDIPYCELYDQGHERIGCLLCPTPFEVHFKKLSSAPVKAKWATNPTAAKRALKLLGQNTIQDWLE